jgi:hypothetical protein
MTEAEKTTYWANRDAGLRGQGEPFNPVGGQARVGNKTVGIKAIKKLTKRARRAGY